MVHSTLGETASKIDRRLVSDVCENTSDLVEANDASATFHLRGRPHTVGPLMNVYNEETLRFLAGLGARNICLPVELPFSATRVLCTAAAALNVTIEVQVFGRQSLALSARCYHARAHGRTRIPAASSARTIPTAWCWQRSKASRFWSPTASRPCPSNT